MLRPLAPSPDDVRQMLTDLARVVGSMTAVAHLLGTTYPHIYRWRTGARNPSFASSRAVWLLWWVLVKRRPITRADLLTWGRASEAKERKRRAARVCRYPGWDFEI